jgi:hypothetical protein
MNKFTVRLSGGFEINGPEEFLFQESRTTTVGGLELGEAQAIEDAAAKSEKGFGETLQAMLAAKRKETAA